MVENARSINIAASIPLAIGILYRRAAIPDVVHGLAVL